MSSVNARPARERHAIPVRGLWLLAALAIF